MIDIDVYGSRSRAVIEVRNDGVSDQYERGGTRLGMRLLHADAKRLGATITSGCATESGWRVALVIPAPSADTAGAHGRRAGSRRRKAAVCSSEPVRRGRPPGPLLIVGGYGLVGSAAARLLRRRNPELEIILAGRRVDRAAGLAAELDASAVAVDVCAPSPLDRLEREPTAILATVSDPLDRLLADAIRREIPIADINRAGTASIADAAVLCAHRVPTTPVLLCGAWMSGLSAMLGAIAASALDTVERIEIAVLVSSRDRVGRDSWGFSRRLAWPFQVTRDGRRELVQPLTGVRRVHSPDGRRRPGVPIATLEQITLPVTLGVPTVQTRLVSQQAITPWGLVALKRAGAIRAFELPGVSGIGDRLLHRSGGGDVAGLSATAAGGGQAATIDVLDFRGQAHLNGLGAARAAERVLGIAAPPLPAGISFPEDSVDPDADLRALAQAGAIVRTHLPAGASSRSPDLPIPHTSTAKEPSPA